MEKRAIEIIKDTCSIENVISQYTRLVGSKPQLKGMCPLHKDGKPSFFVNTARSVFFCHGCQKGGDVLTFIQEVEKIPLPDAISFLADKYGIEVEGSPSVSPGRRRYLSNLQTYLRESLDNNCGERATLYLHERGVDIEQAENHNVGYFPDNAKSRGFLRSEFAQALGLRRLVGRVTFPFYSYSGAIVGYGARTITDQSPKYTNTSNSGGFKKSKCLFGFNYAKKHTTDVVVVVEGYLDVLAVNESGMRAVVATCGTALTDDHAKKLSNRWSTVILCMDSDPAGREAVARAIPILYKHGLNVFVAKLDEGEDPHSTPPMKLLKALQSGRHGYDVIIDTVSSNPFEAANQLRPVLMTLPPACRYVMFERVGAKLGLPQALFTTPSTGMPPAMDVLQPVPNTNLDYLLLFLIHRNEEADALTFMSPSDIKDDWYKWAFEKLYDGEPVSSLINQSRDNPAFSSALSRLSNTAQPTGFVEIAVQSACLVVAQSIAAQIYDAVHSEPTDFELIKSLQERRRSLMNSVHMG